MDLVRLIIFLKSGIGKFLVLVIILSCLLPQFLLKPFSIIAGIIFIVLLIVGIVDLFKNIG